MNPEIGILTSSQGKERQAATEHKNYEQKRKQRLEAERKQAELERERRRRLRREASGQ